MLKAGRRGNDPNLKAERLVMNALRECSMDQVRMIGFHVIMRYPRAFPELRPIVSQERLVGEPVEMAVEESPS
jgi:hypothetical protein